MGNRSPSAGQQSERAAQNAPALENVPALRCAALGLRIALVANCLLGRSPSFCAAQTPGSYSHYLRAAEKIANWLESSRVEREGGLSWPPDPSQPDELVHDLYSGTAGVVLFFSEMAAATSDERYQNLARRGAATLIREVESSRDETPVGLFIGIAGHGYVLTELGMAMHEKAYLDASKTVVEHLGRTAQSVRAELPDAIHWNGITDIIAGSAGIGFFLLDADRRLAHPAALTLATQAGDGLLAMAQPVTLNSGNPGSRWMMSAEYDREMPNYSHGTAGICHFLLALDKRLREKTETARAYDGRFLQAATAGARYLESIADRSEGGCVILHHQPGGEHLYYLGWCHGPAGSGRLFWELANATGDEAWRQLARGGIESLLRSHPDRERTPGFWNNVGLCCGSCGVAAYLTETPGHLEDVRIQALVRNLTRDVLARSTEVVLPDGRVGLKWVQAEHRVQPDLLIAQTGMMQGAAGVGLWLLKMDSLVNQRPFDVTLPAMPR
jgi:lantibiotic modifying enzyme